eukprot:629867_1
MNTALEIPWEHFVHSPSRKDGISEHVERFLRADTCKFIDEFGYHFSLTGKIRLLACSLFHTFYLRVSFHSIPRWEAAVACLIIAAKIENKVQTVKKITRAAAHYLRPHLHFDDPKRGTLPPKQFYHWMSRIHIRERQIIERLYGELRTSLPIQSLKLCQLRDITFDADERMLNLKNKHLSYVFHGCFAVLRKLFRSVLCIYYPPPWLAAVAVFKSLRAYNKKRLTSDKEKKAGPKLYLKYEWFKLFDPTKRLNLNTIQYISDEIDACDDAVISVRDYTSIPYEICGVKTWTLAKRISLIRTTPFDQLAVEMQDDLRDAFKLRKTECIDLRCEKIRAIEAQNDALKLQQENTNNAVDIDWIGGAGPTHAQTIAALMKEQKRLKNKLRMNPNLEEGEIEEEEIHLNVHKMKRKRSRMDWTKQEENDETFWNENSSKNFETKTTQRRRHNMKEDLFHCGMETYEYVQKKGENSTRRMDEDSDMYCMNWCTQRFEFDDDGRCYGMQPKIEQIKAKNQNVMRIPTPNYVITPSDIQGVSPVTPGYAISPITPNYGQNNNNEYLNDESCDNVINTHSFITKTKRNNYLPPPLKKMKTNHHRK